MKLLNTNLEFNEYGKIKSNKRFSKIFEKSLHTNEYNSYDLYSFWNRNTILSSQEMVGAFDMVGYFSNSNWGALLHKKKKTIYIGT